MSIEHREIGTKAGYDRVVAEFFDGRINNQEDNKEIEISGESALIIRDLLGDVILDLRSQIITPFSEIPVVGVWQVVSLAMFRSKLTKAGKLLRREFPEDLAPVSFGDRVTVSMSFQEVRNLGLSSLRFLQENGRSLFLSRWTSSDFYRAFVGVDDAFVQSGGQGNTDLRKYFESQIQPVIEESVP